MRWFREPLWVLPLIVSMFTPAAAAQTSSTEILGLVTDTSPAAVPRALVTITRKATTETRTAFTNDAGEYSFPLIEIGDYLVQVEKPGFKSQRVPNLHVNIQEKARVNFTLEVGQVTETIIVSALAVALQTENAAVGQVIDNKRIIELPLNGRNLNQLAVLVAGVQFGARTGLADGQGGFPIPGASVSVIANGKREITQTVTLDGVDAKEPRTHITVFTPSIEAVEEFKVQTSSYSAEYGQGGGAIIQISMKSGTNQLRGTLFEFLRNDKLDAESYFLNFERPAGAPRLSKDRLRRNQFGAVISGPVVVPGYNGRNRTFWAFDYEARRETLERVQTAWFPNQNFRNGDFSALLTPAINAATSRLVRAPILIYDPLTGEPFSNNVVPRSRLHQGAQNLLKFLPAPQFQQPDLLDFTNRAAVPQIIAQNQYFWRVDHNFRDTDRVFARFAADRSRRDDEFINPNFPTLLPSRGTNLATQWIHMFNQNLLNELRFGLNWALSNLTNPRSNTDFDADALGVGQYPVAVDGNRKLRNDEAGVPFFGFTLGDRDAGTGLENLKTFQFADNLSLSRSKHNLKMGGEYRYVRLERRAGNSTRGTVGFSAAETGFDFASLLLGYPNSSSTPEGRSLTVPRANRWGAYVLDDWKATPRLTVNFGLRWDYFGVPVDADGLWRSVDFRRTFTTPAGLQIPTLNPPLGPGGNIKLWEQEYRFFQPRLGIAFRPTNQWVIRTGAGWFANVEHMNNFAIMQLAPPQSGSFQFNSVTDPARTIPVSLNNQSFTITTRRFRPGSTVLTLDNPFAGSAGVRPFNLIHIQPDHKSSDHWQWSFDIQRELPLSTALTVAYVGSKTTHVPNSINNFNTGPPSPDTNFQRRRPFQQFYDDGRIQDLGTIRYLDSYANGFYHGLQATVEKRYSRGLSYGLAYSFSKAHGDGPAGGNENSGFQDPRDRGNSRGRYFFDQRQSAVAHFVYELPFGSKLHGVPAAFLEGWQTNGIVTLRSGFPFTVIGGDLNTGGGDLRPDRIADGRLGSDQSRRRWFDPSAFRRTTCNIPSRQDLCHFGNSGVGILESPGQRNLDFSIFKNFQIRENTKLQFRTELFN
ncbi:MAG: TonB-dependent receptor domain-containing protein, partial [Bryobacteraceae bacterium]